MSEKIKIETGSVAWFDLTVEEAEQVKNFYEQVVGWKAQPVNMGDYSDFSMASPENGEVKTGICHARGTNSNLPPQWLIYITVKNVEESALKCADLGGKIIVPPKDMGQHGRFCVIQDPAGAFAALFTPAG